MSAVPAQVLTFCVGGETYGIDILCVHEIRGWSPVTRIPNSPSQLSGVLNLRGTIVPVIDMRVRFGVEAGITPSTVIVVLSLQGARGRREVGLVVDSVADVLELAPDSVRDLPPVGTRDNSDLLGLATLGGRTVMLLEPAGLVQEERGT
ncbi:MAG: chemotaxis protein CheW [Steroidobacteraceae bacterium]|nr:chemotaxis protein CheW [Steroidobacteraceae bacterium]MCW5574163.1 chemotaxis protein CheW [Steroidobacteraceae bacterium]